MSGIVDVEVPEIWFKAQRVLRTIVASLVALVPIANGVALAVAEYLRVQEDVVIPAWVFLVLNAVIAGTALVMGLVTRIMAVPGVNEWLTKVGLGSVPKKAIEPDGAIAIDPKVVATMTGEEYRRIVGPGPMRSSE